MKTQGRIEDGQVIIAPSFGARKIEYADNFKNSNLNIAYQIEDVYPERDIPVILQKEVAEAARRWMFKNGKIITAIIKRHRIEGKYLDTYEVLAQAVEAMKENGWKKAIIVGHPAHIPRIKAVLEKMGMEVIIPSGLETIPYDPLSIQWWTRGPLRWWIREIPTRIFYKLKGYI